MPRTQDQDAYLGQLKAQLSEARLAPYLRAAAGDDLCALARYYWNVELCQAFYPVLHDLEIATRNNLDRVLRPLFPVRKPVHIDSWLDRVPPVIVHEGGADSIFRAKQKLTGWDRALGRYRGSSPTHDDLVAGMSFGFWAGLIESTYDRPGTKGIFFWPDHAKAVFPGAAGTLMAPLRSSFNQLRHFRNRVFHHEPIWQKRKTDKSPKESFDAILEALRWLGGEQSQIAANLHKTPEIFDEATQIPLMEERLVKTIDKAFERARVKRETKKLKKESRDTTPGTS